MRPCSLFSTLVFSVSLCLAGCSSSSPKLPCADHHLAPEKNPPTDRPQNAADPLDAPSPLSSCSDDARILTSKQNRANCFHLRPAPTVVTTEKSPLRGKKEKAGIATKQSKKKVAKETRKKTRKVVRTVGLCQPQSLIYARCRTGITTCRLGNTSPVQWFACARKNGATSNIPVAGSVIVIDAHPERRIHTGHPAYVEEARRNDDGSWSLRISHTNYDRRCHLDLDANVIFYPCSMTASFTSGPWSTWAKKLRVLGFILH